MLDIRAYIGLIALSQKKLPLGRNSEHAGETQMPRTTAKLIAATAPWHADGRGGRYEVSGGTLKLRASETVGKPNGPGKDPRDGYILKENGVGKQ